MGNNQSKAATSRKGESHPRTEQSLESRNLHIPEPDEVLSESIFHSMLTLERGRAERSGKPFVLMLLDANLENGKAERILQRALQVIKSSKRETDLCGWYARGAIVGIIFTEVSQDEQPITQKLRAKIEAAFAKQLGKEQSSRISMSVHVFPEGMESGNHGRSDDSEFYRDHRRNGTRKRLHMA